MPTFMKRPQCVKIFTGVFTHYLIHTASLLSGFYPHFTGEETEAQSSDVRFFSGGHITRKWQG